MQKETDNYCMRVVCQTSGLGLGLGFDSKPQLLFFYTLSTECAVRIAEVAGIRYYEVYINNSESEQ